MSRATRTYDICEGKARVAGKFYVALGFVPSQNEPMTLMVTLADILEVLKAQGRKNN